MRTSRIALAFLLSVGSVFASTTNVVAQGAPAMVILVRHAEKATVGGSDPSISEAGQVRAKALAAAIADAHVTAIITTTFKRTFETAEPFATAHGITIEKLAVNGDVAAAVRKHAGEVVLVVGHSNTVPAIVNALGGPKLPDICDASYATMFMLVPSKDGKSAQVVKSKYGPADPDGAETCSTPMR
ncbi:MAG: phosphoglycerate mutase family protein [Gemmatimonadaceae bacterium]